MFTKTPGWYLQYRVFGSTLNTTTAERLKATTEKEAIEEATLLWKQKEKSATEGRNLRWERVTEVFPNTPQLVFYCSSISFVHATPPLPMLTDRFLLKPFLYSTCGARRCFVWQHARIKEIPHFYFEMFFRGKGK